MKNKLNAILGRVVNNGLYTDLEKALDELARMPDDMIDEELLIIIEQICNKFHCGKTGNNPDCKSRPTLCQKLKELCGDRLPKLRLRLNPPTTTASARKPSKGPKM